MKILLNDTVIAAAGTVLDARTTNEITALESVGGIVVDVSEAVGARILARFSAFRRGNAARDSDVLTLLALSEGAFDPAPDLPGIRATTGTTEVLAAGDDGGTVTFDNAAPTNVEVPPGLRVGFSVAVIQLGAGQVTVTAGAGVTLTAPLGDSVARQGGAAGLTIVATNTAVIGGDVV